MATLRSNDLSGLLKPPPFQPLTIKQAGLVPRTVKVGGDTGTADTLCGQDNRPGRPVLDRSTRVQKLGLTENHAAGGGCHRIFRDGRTQSHHHRPAYNAVEIHVPASIRKSPFYE
jgi:hypothetical protein